MNNWLFAPTDNLGTMLAAAGGAAIVAGGLWLNLKQWRAEAASRRHQELENRIEKFHTPETRAALMMIHYYERIIPLIDAKEPVRWEEIEVALIPALYRQYLFEPRLTAIRDCFNDLLEGLTNLHFLMQQKLVQEDDVDHIARGLLVRIATYDARIYRNLRLYIIWRRTGIMSLFRRYGCDIGATLEADKRSLESDIAAGRYGECVGSPWGELKALKGTEEGAGWWKSFKDRRNRNRP
jgi:hypothetical protein